MGERCAGWIAVRGGAFWSAFKEYAKDKGAPKRLYDTPPMDMGAMPWDQRWLRSDLRQSSAVYMPLAKRPTSMLRAPSW